MAYDKGLMRCSGLIDGDFMRRFLLDSELQNFIRAAQEATVTLSEEELDKWLDDAFMSFKLKASSNHGVPSNPAFPPVSGFPSITSKEAPVSFSTPRKSMTEPMRLLTQSQPEHGELFLPDSDQSVRSYAPQFTRLSLASSSSGHYPLSPRISAISSFSSSSSSSASSSSSSSSSFSSSSSSSSASSSSSSFSSSSSASSSSTSSFGQLSDQAGVQKRFFKPSRIESDNTSSKSHRDEDFSEHLFASSFNSSSSSSSKLRNDYGANSWFSEKSNQKPPSSHTEDHKELYFSCSSEAYFSPNEKAISRRKADDITSSVVTSTVKGATLLKANQPPVKDDEDASSSRFLRSSSGGRAADWKAASTTMEHTDGSRTLSSLGFYSKALTEAEPPRVPPSVRATGTPSMVVGNSLAIDLPLADEMSRSEHKAQDTHSFSTHIDEKVVRYGNEDKTGYKSLVLDDKLFPSSRGKEWDKRGDEDGEFSAETSKVSSVSSSTQKHFSDKQITESSSKFEGSRLRKKPQKITASGVSYEVGNPRDEGAIVSPRGLHTSVSGLNRDLEEDKLLEVKESYEFSRKTAGVSSSSSSGYSSSSSSLSPHSQSIQDHTAITKVYGSLSSQQASGSYDGCQKATIINETSSIVSETKLRILDDSSTSNTPSEAAFSSLAGYAGNEDYIPKDEFKTPEASVYVQPAVDDFSLLGTQEDGSEECFYSIRASSEDGSFADEKLVHTASPGLYSDAGIIHKGFRDISREGDMAGHYLNERDLNEGQELITTHKTVIKEGKGDSFPFSSIQGVDVSLKELSPEQSDSAIHGALHESHGNHSSHMRGVQGIQDLTADDSLGDYGPSQGRSNFRTGKDEDGFSEFSTPICPLNQIGSVDSSSESTMVFPCSTFKDDFGRFRDATSSSQLYGVEENVGEISMVVSSSQQAASSSSYDGAIEDQKSSFFDGKAHIASSISSSEKLTLKEKEDRLTRSRLSANEHDDEKDLKSFSSLKMAKTADDFGVDRSSPATPFGGVNGVSSSGSSENEFAKLSSAGVSVAVDGGKPAAISSPTSPPSSFVYSMVRKKEVSSKSSMIPAKTGPGEADAKKQQEEVEAEMQRSESDEDMGNEAGKGKSKKGGSIQLKNALAKMFSSSSSRRGEGGIKRLLNGDVGGGSMDRKEGEGLKSLLVQKYKGEGMKKVGNMTVSKEEMLPQNGKNIGGMQQEENFGFFDHYRYNILSPTLDEKTESELLKVFSASNSEGIDLQTFESEIVVPLLRLGKLLSRPLFQRITQDAPRMKYDVLKKFWQGRFISGDLDPSLNDVFSTERFSILAPNPPPDSYDNVNGHSISEYNFTVNNHSVWNFFQCFCKDSSSVLEADDFGPYISEIIDRNVHMSFLVDYAEYRIRYEETVMARIMYDLDLENNGKIRLQDLRKSSLVHLWCSIDENLQVSHIRPFFSYEHFYVILYLFSRLDEDRDMLLDRDAFIKYDNHTLNTLAAEGIWSQVGFKFTSSKEGYMCFNDWTVFLLHYEDMTTEASISFWFKIIDVDGDGCIRDHEVQTFLDQQNARFAAYGLEEVRLEDWLCQMNDAICPRREGQFYISDLKRKPKLAAHFFGSLVSLTKWLNWDQRDVHREYELANRFEGFTQWDLFCRIKYDEAFFLHLEECEGVGLGEIE